MLVVVMPMIVSSDNDWMDCINDPRGLGATIALAVVTVVFMGIRAARGGNKDAHNAGKRQPAQHRQKTSRTIHFVLHLLVCRQLPQIQVARGSENYVA